jgi:hypothetical protein
MGASSSTLISSRSSKYLDQFLLARSQGNSQIFYNEEFLFQQFSNNSEYLCKGEAQEFLKLLISKTYLRKIIEDGIKKKNKNVTSEQWRDIYEEFAAVIFNEVDPKVTNKMNQEQFFLALNKDWTKVITDSMNQGATERKFIKRLRETPTKPKGGEKLERSNSVQSNIEKPEKTKLVYKSSPQTGGIRSQTEGDSENKVPLSRSNESPSRRSTESPSRRSTESPSSRRSTEPNSAKKAKKNKKLKRPNRVEELDAIWEEHLKLEDIEEKVDQLGKVSRALTKSGVHSLRSNMISSVTEIMQIKPQFAQSLLNKANWDKNKLLAEYFNDPEEFLKKQNLDKNAIMAAIQEHNSNITDEKISCSICFDDFELSQMTKLDSCGHLFCNDCWGENLEFQISTGHTLDIKCMHHGCDELVPAHVVQSLVRPELCTKYDTFLGKTFVDNSKDIKWCSAPGCDLALSEPVSEGKILVLTCACGNRVCWKCKKEAHPPVTCDHVSKFETEAGDQDNLKFMIENRLDADTLKWMHENTKQCPFCNVSVQKNDGCFCMTCGNCHNQWCWLCRGDWSTHPDHFSCSTYGADRSQLEDKPAYQDESQYNQRLAAEKLAQFFRQYYDQSQSMELESSKDNKKRDLDKIKELTTELESLDVSFIREGRLTVKKCRESLKYSYIYSYYNRENPDNILQFLQESLAMCIEKLAQSLQKPSITISAPEVRKTTKIASMALENLLSHFCAQDTNTNEKKEKEKIRR